MNRKLVATISGLVLGIFLATGFVNKKRAQGPTYVHQTPPSDDGNGTPLFT